MGFRNGAYATVWDIKPGRGNYTDVRLSIGRKDQTTGEYNNDFSGFCMFIGNARAKAESLHERDRIQLKEVDVSNVYDKERQREYTNFKVFDFDRVESNFAPGGAPAPRNSAPPTANTYEGDAGDEPLPF